MQPELDPQQIRETLAQRVWQVDFDVGQHQYWLEDKCLPSVTDVLEYAGFTNHEFADASARDRGSRVHEAISDMERYGLSADEAAEVLPKGERGYIHCYDKFREETGFKVIASEQRLLGMVPAVFLNSTLLFSGTTDLVGLLDGQLAIVDFKTSQRLDKHVGFQLAAYEIALMATALRFGLRLDRSGEYKNASNLREYTNAADAAYFAAALIVMYARRGRNFYKPMERKVRAIDTSGDVARVVFPYNEDDVRMMKDLGLSRFWESKDKAYLVPFEALDDQTLSRLEQAGFEVK